MNEGEQPPHHRRQPRIAYVLRQGQRTRIAHQLPRQPGFAPAFMFHPLMARVFGQAIHLLLQLRLGFRYGLQPQLGHTAFHVKTDPIELLAVHRVSSLKKDTLLPAQHGFVPR